MENIFDLKLESLGRKTAHTGNPKKKDREFSENKSQFITGSVLTIWSEVNFEEQII